jgi:riboflavin biosynthesis pyrimidine reductase
VRQIFPEPAEVVPAEAYAYPPDRTWLRANMISSVDGAATDGDKSGGLGSQADQAVFSTLRGLADVVLVGASTVRIEGYGPVQAGVGWGELRAGRPPVPRLAVVSRRLDLDFDSPIFTESQEPVLVLTCETAPADGLKAAGRAGEVMVAGRDEVDFGAAVDRLVARGLRRMLCEGGPRVLAQVAADGVLDELCLTVSPLLVAGDAVRILNGVPLPAPERLRLERVLTEEDFVFLRYTR